MSIRGGIIIPERIDFPKSSNEIFEPSTGD